jgi:hypothetical protein
MSYFVQKADFIDNTIMWADIINELTVNGGFKLISVNGSSLAPSIDTTVGIQSAVIEATTLVDSICTAQPWRICVKVTADYTRIYAATPTQIQDDGTVAVSAISSMSRSAGSQPPADYNEYAGTIGNYHYSFYSIAPPAYSATTAQLEYAFYSKGKVCVKPTGVFGDVTDVGSLSTFYESDYRYMPFSYAISCTDHGLVFASWIEGKDGTGNNQNWFVIQRAINSDGSVVTTGKAPLFCMYSVNNASIRRFTVREADVNVPTLDVDAVADSTDANRVINNKQQVCFSENGRFDFKFPQGFNTARYSYAYQIDMLAYTSADVCSQRLDVQVQVYNEKDAQGNPKLRTYRALGANGVNNTNMRVFMIVPDQVTP